jgi:hypothetical protein
MKHFKTFNDYIKDAERERDQSSYIDGRRRTKLTPDVSVCSYEQYVKWVISNAKTDSPIYKEYVIELSKKQSIRNIVKILYEIDDKFSRQLQYSLYYDIVNQILKEDTEKDFWEEPNKVVLNVSGSSSSDVEKILREMYDIYDAINQDYKKILKD